jgi:hypothetical protein
MVNILLGLKRNNAKAAKASWYHIVCDNIIVGAMFFFGS